MKKTAPDSTVLLPPITEEKCRERFLNALRDYVGPGKAYSVENVADKIDTNQRTMYSYISGENMPRLPQFFRMCRLFGPAFANRMLHIAGLDGCFRQEAEAVTDYQVNGDVCQLVGEFGHALRDGRLDHRERPEIVHEIEKLIPVLQDYVAAARDEKADDAPRASRVLAEAGNA